MAIGWLTVLQKLPWVEVIANAPKVAEGARKLWNAVAKKPPLAAPQATSVDPVLSSEAQSVAALQARVAALETAALDLHNQMLTSSELIKALAEQNTQLVKAIETNRILFVRLLLTTIAIGLIAAASLILSLVR